MKGREDKEEKHTADDTIDKKEAVTDEIIQQAMEVEQTDQDAGFFNDDAEEDEDNHNKNNPAEYRKIKMLDIHGKSFKRKICKNRNKQRNH